MVVGCRIPGRHVLKGVGFYASTPLLDAQSRRIGMLCALITGPRLPHERSHLFPVMLSSLILYHSRLMNFLLHCWCCSLCPMSLICMAHTYMLCLSLHAYHGLERERENVLGEQDSVCLSKDLF